MMVEDAAPDVWNGLPRKVFPSFWGMKPALFVFLVVRVTLNVRRICAGDEFKTFVKGRFCHMLTDETRAACLQEVAEIMQQNRTDFEFNQHLVAKTEWSFAMVRTLQFFLSVIAFALQRKSQNLFTVALALNHLASLSVLRALTFLNLNFLMVTWKAEWLPGLHGLLYGQVEDAKKRQARLTRGFAAIVGLMVVLAASVKGMELLKVKLLLMSPLLQVPSNEWSRAQWLEFVLFVNCLVGVVNTQSLSLNSFKLAHFSGNDAAMNADEVEQWFAFRDRFADQIRKEFSSFQATVLICTLGPDDYQKAYCAWTDRLDRKRRDTVRGSVAIQQANSEVLEGARMHPCLALTCVVLIGCGTAWQLFKMFLNPS